MTSLLTLGETSGAVAVFQTLVEDTLYETAKTALDNPIDASIYLSDAIAGDKLPIKTVATFTQDLYNKAMALPEVAFLSLNEKDEATQNYGLFKGGNTYKTFEGDIDQSNVREQLGWIIPDNSTNDYYLFSNNDSQLIISSNDFEPRPIVEDFSPLRDELLSKQRAEQLIDDIHNCVSLVVSMKDTTADLVQTIGSTAEQFAIDEYSSASDYKEKVGDVADNKIQPIKKRVYANNPQLRMDFGDEEIEWQQQQIIEENQLASMNNANQSLDLYNKNKDNPGHLQENQVDIQVNTSNNITNHVQAVMYAVNGKEVRFNSKDYHVTEDHIIYCYQLPENISYSAAAGYDSVSPRGAQVPFQFYQGANAMSLSFTLNFHYDELKIFNDPHKSLAQIAKIAENFTRPWCADNDENSIFPKLVKVILPGISRIGYLQSANITFSGSITGEDLSPNKYNESADLSTFNVNAAATTFIQQKSADFTYSQLSISFDLLILNDVDLYQVNEMKFTVPDEIEWSSTESVSNTEIEEKETTLNVPTQESEHPTAEQAEEAACKRMIEVNQTSSKYPMFSYSQTPTIVQQA